MSTLQFGDAIWDPNPTLHNYIGDGIDLDRIQIPKGVEVLEFADEVIGRLEAVSTDNEKEEARLHYDSLEP